MYDIWTVFVKFLFLLFIFGDVWHCMGVNFDYNFLFLCLLGIPMDWILGEDWRFGMDWFYGGWGLKGIGL